MREKLYRILISKFSNPDYGTVTCTEKPAACQMFLAAIADQSTKIGCGAATCKEAIQSDSNSSRENIASFYCMFNSAPDVNQVPFSYSFEKSEIASQCETTVEKFQLCGEPTKKPPAATRPVKSALINSLPIESSSFQEKLANRFNKIRHLVADGNIFAKQFPNFQVDNQVIQATSMPDLSWSAELAKESQQIADQCTVIRPRDEIPQKSYAYSMNATALENLTAEKVENNQDFHGKLVVDWIYNYLKDAKNKFNADGSFSCYGIDQTDIMSCRKFLSLISDQTTNFGCGVAACSEITMGRRPVIANVMNFVCTFDNLPEVEQIPYAHTVKSEVVEEEKPVSISSGLSANRNLVQPVEIGDDSVTLSAERYKELMTAQAVAKQLEAIVALMHLL